MKINALFCLAVGSLACSISCAQLHVPEDKMLLDQSWSIQDSSLVSASDEDISTVGFATSKWVPSTVPSTVLGTLITQNIYPEVQDPFFGKNIRKLPGTFYPIATNFEKIKTPPESPFGRAWWYRREFVLPETFKDQQVVLNLEGVSQSAEVWINGKKVASASEMEGMYRTHHLNVTAFLNASKTNALAIKINPPEPTDLNASWEDWNPTPNDKNMGLWREASLTFHRQVILHYPQVITRLDLPSTDVAHLTVEVDVSNTANQEISGILKGEFEGASFSRNLTLQAQESKTISFTSEEFKSLNVKNPKLWWPNQMGDPHLYPLHFTFQNRSGWVRYTTDRLDTQFGIRQVTSELIPEGSRLFKINGKAILIRGAGWSQDLFLRFSKDRVEKELQYVRDLNLNTIRFEGRFEPEYFLEMTDRYGILVMPGWPCCNSWQYPERWPEKNFKIAADSLRDQIREFRSHPSVFVFLYGSDESPPEKVEHLYLDTLEKYHWSNPFLSSAADRKTPITGKTGVKMNGPYNYVAPSYWLMDHEFGGGWGFNTETSPGPAVPPIESLKQFIPANHWWPIDDEWNFHAGNGTFKHIEIFTQGLNARYGKAASAEEFAMKSQVMTYDGHRAMFEAYAKNKYRSATGVIQWMLNNAWPSLIWHLYDYYLRPSGAYYGVKKATEPLHIQYSYDDQSIVGVNSTYHASGPLKASTQMFNFDLKPVFAKTLTVELPADQSVKLLTLPEAEKTLKHDSKTYFVKLRLENANGKIVSDNFYWLSTQPEIYDWKKTDYHHTPMLQEGDLTDLNSLPRVRLLMEPRIQLKEKSGEVTVTNPSQALAFSTHLKLVRKDNHKEVLPVLWSDNYFSLLPEEKRTITFQFPQTELGSADVELQLDGWNTYSDSPASRVFSAIFSASK